MKLDLILLTALGALLACQPNAPESSSSSHWFTCQQLSQCGDAQDAVSCSRGYCVDAEGERIARPTRRLQAPVAPATLPETPASSVEPGVITIPEDADLPGNPDQPVGQEPATASDAGADTGSDAGPDAAVAPQPLDGFEVSVIADEHPVAGAHLALYDVQGKVLEEFKTDASGLIHSDREVAMVTLAHTWGGGIETYIGVERGDRMVLPHPSLSSPQLASTLYDVTLPALPAGSDKVEIYSLRTGCRSYAMGSRARLTLSAYPECMNDKTTFLARATRKLPPNADGFELDELLGFSWLTGVGRPASAQPAPITFSAWRAPKIADITVHDLPERFIGASKALWIWNGTDPAEAPQHPPAFDFYYPPEFSEDLEAEVALSYSMPDGGVEWHLLHKRTAPSDHIELSASQLLPMPTRSRVRVASDPAAVEISWEMTDAGAADYVKLDLFYSSGGASGGARSWWRIYLPPTRTSFTLPAIPQSFGIGAIDPDSIEVRAISYGASDSVASYRAFRNRGIPFGKTAENLDLLGERGSAEIVQWTLP